MRLKILLTISIILSICNISFSQEWNKLDSIFGVSKFFTNANKDTLYALSYNQLLFSVDTCKKWDLLAYVGGPGFYAAAVANGNIVTYSCSNLILFSSDNGKTWNGGGNGFPLGSAAYNAIGVGNYFFIASTHGLYNSSDNGFSWNRCFPIGADTSLDPTIWAICYSDERILLSLSYGIAYSSDSGDTWTTVPYPANVSSSLWGIGYNQGRIFLGCNDGLYISDDDGNTYTRKTNKITDVVGFTFCDRQAFLIDYQNGPFGSKDNGNTWYPIDTGLKIGMPYNYLSIYYFQNLLLTSDNVDEYSFYANYSCAGITNIEPLHNTNFRLFPNPTSDILNLPDEPQLGKIELFTAEGRQVSQFKSLYYNKIDVSLLPSGLYFIDYLMNDGSKKIGQFIKE